MAAAAASDSEKAGRVSGSSSGQSHHSRLTDGISSKRPSPDPTPPLWPSAKLFVNFYLREAPYTDDPSKATKTKAEVFI